MKLTFGLTGILVATLVVLGYLFFIWWLDRYEREPLLLVLLTFAWGAIIGTTCGCTFTSVFQSQATVALDPAVTQLLTVVMIAPLVEELTKGLVLIPLVMTDHFDNETDGLIYGAATGLGFAAVENIIYFLKFMTVQEMGVGQLLFLMAVRTLFTAIMHCISSATLGMAVGYARHRPGFTRVIAPLIGYALAVFNHALWNGLAVFGGFNAGLQLAGVALILVGSAVMFALTQWSLKREHDALRQHLREEARRGTLPAEHAEIVPYWTKRRRDDWLSPSVDKEEYLRAATLLAFRLHQLEVAEGEDRQAYQSDIQHFREKLKNLLHQRS